MKPRTTSKLPLGSRAGFIKRWEAGEKLKALAHRYGYAGPSGPSQWAIRHGFGKRGHGRHGARP